jgi:hypothetical protein
VDDLSQSDKGEVKQLMKRNIMLVLLTGCIFSATFIYATGFKLVDDINTTLTCHIRYAFLSEYDIRENKYDISLSTAMLSLRGELYQWLKFKLSCELREVSGGEPYEYTLSLEDIYAEHEFYDFLSLRFGRFKVPFGEEIFLGAGERPYIDHTETTDGISPGRDLGIMASGSNIWDLFGYDASISTGNVIIMPEDTTLSYLLTGKIFVRYNKKDFIDIKAGYNGYYHYFHSVVSQHELAQGFFASLTWQPDKIQKLSFLSEYAERVQIRNVINQTLDWRRGLTGILSYRYDFIEPVLVFDWYDRSLLDSDTDKGLIALRVGTAAYFLKDDLLRFKLLYRINQPLNGEESIQTISAIIQLEY